MSLPQTETRCASCDGPPLADEFTVHRRGSVFNLLCADCARPDFWVRCDCCGQGSPIELMEVDDAGVCYCPGCTKPFEAWRSTICPQRDLNLAAFTDGHSMDAIHPDSESIAMGLRYYAEHMAQAHSDFRATEQSKSGTTPLPKTSPIRVALNVGCALFILAAVATWIWFAVTTSVKG